MVGPDMPSLRRWLGTVVGSAAALCLVGCGSAEPASRSNPEMALQLLAMSEDPHSYSRPDQVRVTHATFDWTLDFDTQQLSGRVDWVVERVDPAADRLILDTANLRIDGVQWERNGSYVDAEFTHGPATHASFGTPLIIELAPDASLVRVSFRTEGEPKGLQWLAPRQTQGGKHPFVFSQAQPILARSYFPCQDSPGVRFTYDARITAPEGLRVVMAAHAGPVDGGTAHFDMPQPVPSYLVAFAAGDLAFGELGPRSGIWAEPEVLPRALFELADTEAMITATESMYGPYRWDRYDILVLPPSFPFGGMENPRLTFATPTILAGDRSLVALVAHELAHSWSGNLVTNSTWSDLWINEGFTVYLERRIQEAVYGPERAGMEAVLGRQELVEEMQGMPPSDTVLHVALQGRNPDDVFSNVPYEKGYLLLRLLEDEFGRPDFDAFLKAWFDRHAFQSRSASDLESFLMAELFRGDARRYEALRIREWIYAPGLPENAPRPRSARLDALESVTRDFVDQGTLPTGASYTTQEWLRFLRGLPERTPIARLEALDRAFAFTNSGNSEIHALWLEIGIRSDYRVIDGALETFLRTVGRRKFLKPLYTTLAATPEGRARALEIYRTARAGYHSVTSNTIDGILGYQP